MSNTTYYRAKTLNNIKELRKQRIEAKTIIEMSRADYNAMTVEELNELHSLGIKLSFATQSKEEHDAVKEREENGIIENWIDEKPTKEVRKTGRNKQKRNMDTY